MKKLLLQPQLFAPPHVAALERLRQQEDCIASRDVERQLLVKVKRERDPIGPRREVDIHKASPHFELSTVKLTPFDRPMTPDAQVVLWNEMHRERETAKAIGMKLKARARRLKKGEGKR